MSADVLAAWLSGHQLAWYSINWLYNMDMMTLFLTHCLLGKGYSFSICYLFCQPHRMGCGQHLNLKWIWICYLWLIDMVFMVKMHWDLLLRVLLIKWANISCLVLSWLCQANQDDIIRWEHFLHYWPFVTGIHWSPVDSLHKGHWSGALM